MSEAILEVCGLTCERGERTLFRNLSFAVKPGTLVRIAGSNGAGKTTLLRLMTGLMRPVEGEVRWRGVPVEKAAQDFWCELCYIGHRNGVKDDLSVLENVMINANVATAGILLRRPSASRMPSCANWIVAPVVGETNLFAQSCCMMRPAMLIPAPVQRTARSLGRRESRKRPTCAASPALRTSWASMSGRAAS